MKAKPKKQPRKKIATKSKVSNVKKPKVKKEKEISTTRREFVFEDDLCKQIVVYDRTIFKNGPISSETIWKKLNPNWERMMSKAAIKKFYQQNKTDNDE